MVVVNLSTTDLARDFHFFLECEVEGKLYELEGIFSTSTYATAVQKLEESFADSEVGELGCITAITIEEIPLGIVS